MTLSIIGVGETEKGPILNYDTKVSHIYFVFLFNMFKDYKT